jgi:hypothetical protein
MLRVALMPRGVASIRLSLNSIEKQVLATIRVGESASKIRVPVRSVNGIRFTNDEGGKPATSYTAPLTQSRLSSP